MIKPSFEILNQKGTPMFYSDVYANIPTAGIVGRMFIATDTYAFYRDTGSGWDLIGGPGTGTITGTGTSGKYAKFGGASTIADGSLTETATKVSTTLNFEAAQIIKTGGLSTEYLKADGSTSTLTNPITGTGVSGQVSYFSGTSALSGSNNLFWDSANNRLGINTATPGVPLDIHTTGTGLSINGTTTNNSLLTFQNAGTGKWQIGNVYNAGANYFRIYDILNSSERLTVSNAGNFQITGKLGIGAAPGAYAFNSNGQGRFDNTSITNGTSSLTIGGTSFNDGGNAQSLLVENQGSNTGGVNTGIKVTNTSTATKNIGIWIAQGGMNVNSAAYQPPTDGLVIGGHVLVNTTTDGTYHLDVNGSARVQSSLDVTGLITQGTAGGILMATGTFTSSGGSTTSFYTFSSVASQQYYLVALNQQGAGGNIVFGIVTMYSGTTGAYNIYQDNTNPVLLLTLGMSGLNLQLTIGSGYGSTTWRYAILKIR